MDPGQQYNTQAKQNSYFDEVLRRAREIPGVTAAGLTDSLPLGRNRGWGVGVKGRNFPPGQSPDAFVRVITDGYIGAMGIPLVDGRDISQRDTPSSQPVILINHTIARALFSNEKAVGKTLYACGERQVIGVVGASSRARTSVGQRDVSAHASM